MRLLTKITILFLLISLVVFCLGYFISSQVISREINFEERRFLEERLRHTERIIKKKQFDKKVSWNKVTITPLENNVQEKPVAFSDTLVMHSDLETIEPHLKLDVTREIGDRFYKISMYDLIIEEEDIHEGVTEAIIKMYLLLLVIVLVLTWLFSSRLLRPFNETLKKIKDFKIQSTEPLQFVPSSTLEFNKLNTFLQEMTDKSRRDYQALKEFTENASHEMQTPISIAKNKLELLMESDNLDEEQVKNIVSAQQSLKKMSRLGNTLSLLNRIDNQEFVQEETVDLSQMVRKMLFDFRELMELKQIEVKEYIEENVKIKIHPVLADTLITNLFQNAIRHNGHDGKIEIILNQKQLQVSNTGNPLSVDPEKLFDRFRKNSPHQESLGLGLSIVKTICEANNIQVCYQNEKEWHIITLLFPNGRNMAGQKETNNYFARYGNR